MSDVPTDELQMVLQLTKTARALTRNADRELGAHHGLSFSDLELLVELHWSPNNRVHLGDLAARLDVSASALVRVLAPLERIGIVKRWSNAENPREGEVELTEAGNELLVHALLTAYEASVEAVSELCSPAQRDALVLFVRESLDAS